MTSVDGGNRTACNIGWHGRHRWCRACSPNGLHIRVRGRAHARRMARIVDGIWGAGIVPVVILSLASFTA